MPVHPITRVLIVVGALQLAACAREDIQVYQIPKEAPSASPRGDGMAPAAQSRDIHWKVPAGWQEQPPSSMRVGSFLIKGENGRQADMSVVPLSGMAGGDLANINRWRGQIGLGPISDANLPAQSQTISPAGRSMLFVDFANQEKRLMAAIYKRGDRSWFFKMTGDDATVLSAKSDFMQFLESLKFHEN